MTQIVITGPERRRHWMDDEKLAILVEAFTPNASPIAVARRHGISSGLLYTWRKKAMARASQPVPADAKPVFLPACVADSEVAPGPAAIPMIEVYLNAGVKVRIEAGMPEAVIAATLKALR
jgi:transposase